MIGATIPPSLAQSQLPRPVQLPPAGGVQAQPSPQGQPQRPQAAPQQTQQPQAAAPRPYQPVAISPPAPMNDPSFEAFRKQLGAVAEKKDRKALADLVSRSFFWLGEKGDQADKKKSGIDNLTTAISLNAKDDSGWDLLIGFASDPTAAPFPERKDTVCAPAEPNFDGKALEALAKATATEESDWGYPTQPGLEMRSGPQPNSPVLEKLGMHFVRVMDDGSGAGGSNPMIRVVAPSGKVGYVPVDAISPLGHDAMCYAKESGRWKIAGFIGGE
jgi:hypothetical protein